MSWANARIPVSVNQHSAGWSSLIGGTFRLASKGALSASNTLFGSPTLESPCKKPTPWGSPSKASVKRYLFIFAISPYGRGSQDGKVLSSPALRSSYMLCRVLKSERRCLSSSLISCQSVRNVTRVSSLESTLISAVSMPVLEPEAQSISWAFSSARC